jgi:hypothetical protein
MIGFTRIMMTVMFAGICFLLIVPLALQRHEPAIAAGMIVLFVIYLFANVVIWRRMKQPRR